MKIVMTLLVRDEQDIIRENIEFHLSMGVNFFIAADGWPRVPRTEIERSQSEKTQEPDFSTLELKKTT